MLGLGAARAPQARPQPPPARKAESAGRARVGSGLAGPPSPLGHRLRHPLRAAAAWGGSGEAGRGGASELRQGAGRATGGTALRGPAPRPRRRPTSHNSSVRFIHLSRATTLP